MAEPRSTNHRLHGFKLLSPLRRRAEAEGRCDRDCEGTTARDLVVTAAERQRGWVRLRIANRIRGERERRGPGVHRRGPRRERRASAMWTRTRPGTGSSEQRCRSRPELRRRPSAVG